MKIIIDIPEDIYDYRDDENYIKMSADIISDALQNGIPLPKCHGRLGDLDLLIKQLRPKWHDAFSEEYYDDWKKGNNCMLEEVIEAIEDFKPIIEADKERSEEISPNGCMCFACKRIITDGKIFPLKDNPKKGLCFKCY